MTMPNDALRGGALIPAVSIGREYEKPILTLIRRLSDDIRREMRRVFAESQHHGAMDDDKGAGAAEVGGNVASQARIALNALLDKYAPLFNRVAKKATKRMIGRTLRNSSATLGMSLRQISEGLTLKTDLMNDRILEIASASTTEAVNLIKLIPQKYLAEVQGQVMRSIVSGGGLQELQPFLIEKYGQNIRHARNVAMDQTRKAYTGINAGRMKALGVKQFEWLHTGGSNEPRKLHVEMNGNIYNLDDPPFIGVMYGQDVYGLPGTLPNCRCRMRPIVNFEADHAA